jgi:Mn2+/Fe2+ NRAMP family transporter
MRAETPAVEAQPPRRSIWRSAALFFAVFGPGLITASVDNDAGGITTYSLAGATYGNGLLWTLLPITLALVVVQEMCARMGVVTGKGLADLIRENFGVKVTFWISVALIVANLGNVIAEFAGVAASLQIFGVPILVSVPLAAAAVWLLVLKGTYGSVEKFFLVASVFYLAYPVSLFFTHPDWGDVARATFIPRIQLDRGYIEMVVAMVGTTIAPWMQFYLQSAVVEKGIKVAFAIVVACAATLHQAGVRVETADQAAQALAPLAGRYATWLFSFGLFNASFFAAAILPLSTAYYVCESFGWESGVDRKYGEAKQFYWLYSSILAIGALVVLVPGLPLVRIMLVSQIVNGVLLPFILVFMLVLINKEKLMGAWRNGRFFNAVAWATTVIMIALTVYLVIAGVRDLLA